MTSQSKPDGFAGSPAREAAGVPDRLTLDE